MALKGGIVIFRANRGVSISNILDTIVVVPVSMFKSVRFLCLRLTFSPNVILSIALFFKSI